jgi:PIN domain nuclease of toxin-antitoxin system
MKLLLDTCTLVWLTAEPELLSGEAAAALDDESNSLYLSDASVWELCLKWQVGKISLPRPPRNWTEEQSRRWSLAGVPISRIHLFRVTELPEHHRDPFDRLLVAQAIQESLTIVTPDAWIRRYPVATLW